MIYRSFLLTVFLSSLFLSGCAVVQVKVDRVSSTTNRKEAQEIRSKNGSNAATEALVRSSKPGLSDAERIGALIEAARLSSTARPGDAQTAVNQSATRQIVSLLEKGNFSSPAVAIAAPDKDTLDPRTATQLIDASAIAIKGLRVRTAQPGVGLPYVAWFEKGSPALRNQPGIPRAGMSVPVTALMTFPKGKPTLTFHRTLRKDLVLVNGRREQLATDFSAPLAYLLIKGRNRAIDPQALIYSDKNIKNAGLLQFQEYDPTKIPVVFVHGLLSRPEAWTQAVNELLADPEIRARYQFWFYLYPTGLPVWWSAAKLRAELNRFRTELDPKKTNPNLDKMVLVGHSMGGLISSLMIREGGEKLWRQFTDTPPEKLEMSKAAKQQLLEIVNFKPRADVSRVIFVATPHQGSKLALNPVADFFSSLIRLPSVVVSNDRAVLLGVIRSDLRDLFVAPANSIRFLRANSPLLVAIQKLPHSTKIPYHSVIGDQGKGDTPKSSDGVVPYWSSHLSGAVSEKIVPSSHGANEHPDGIEEIRRILQKY
jgi:pimeloyl-ACP methyl ester carboxylesterase